MHNSKYSRYKVVLSIFLGIGFAFVMSVQANAQIVTHGATIAKGCVSPKSPGDTVNCDIIIGYNDSAGDSISIDEAWDIADFGIGRDNVRVPLAGNLPISAVNGNTTCTIAGALPCLIGPAGSTLNDLPGTGINGSVTFNSNTYVIQANDPDPLVDQGNANVHDLCDALNTSGCNQSTNTVQFTSQTDLNFDSSTVTNVHDASHAAVLSVPAGTTVHDNAAVSGDHGVPTGTVDFSFFTTEDCTGEPTVQAGVALNGSGVAESSDYVTTTSGALSYMADYNGSSNYKKSTGICEPLEITKLESSVTTQIKDPNDADITGTTVPTGTVIYDQATVSGSLGVPTGTVDFRRFTTVDCTDTSTDEDDVALDTAGVANSSDFITGVGFVSFLVHYDGDTTYNESTGICEPLTVSRIPAAVRTEIQDESDADVTGQTVDVGTTVHDKAFVTDGTTPTGTVDFMRFATDNCTGTSTDQLDVALAADGTAVSDLYVTVAGALSYLVHYDGDVDHDPADGICEVLDVQKLTPGVRTTILDENDVDVTNTEVASGTLVHDKVYVDGSGEIPTGTVDFKLFSNLECSGDPTSTESDVALDSSVNPAWALSAPLSATADMAYMAHYDGDANYLEADGICEPLPVAEFVGCTLTQGYWKNHPEDWPVLSLTLGSVNYTQAQLLSIFKRPVKGNGLVSLAHQLIAAKLNIAAGASDSDISATITAADTIIGALIVPPVGTGSLSTSSVSSLVSALDSFNNGATGPGHCDSN